MRVRRRGRDAAETVAATIDRFTAAGVSHGLARRVGAALDTFGLLDVAEVAELAERDATGTVELEGPDAGHVAALYYALSAHLDIDRMLSSVSALPRGNRWHALARLALRDDLYASLREISLDVLRGSDAWADPGTMIGRWSRRTRRG